MLPDVECLILGGGCAGLSLAMRLAEQGAKAPETLILERRQEYDNDRTWCFWGDHSAPLQQLRQHHWNHLRLSKEGAVIAVDCTRTPYQMLAAGRFYGAAIAAIERSRQIELLTGVAIEANPLWQNGRWQVPTARGVVSAKMLIDTRAPALPAPGGALLWQSFLGHEIECAQAVFDPLVAHLMDFTAPSTQHVAFTYVLPLSPTRALIEYTLFAEQPYSAAEIAAALAGVIAQRVNGARFSVLRSEQGVLPMGLPAAKSLPLPPSSIHAGLFGGGCRPATGFAFQRIQRWAAECAMALSQGRMPLPHRPDPWLLRQMDRIFLQVMRRSPQLAPDMFMAMFQDIKTERVIRFLSDQGRVADYLAMVCALPPAPFLRQLLPGGSGWRRPATAGRA